MNHDSTSLEQRVLLAIRRHFQLYGCSPSYIDIAIAVSIQPRHVGRPLTRLQKKGMIVRTAGVARSIALVDRLLNYSNAELEYAVRQRGGNLVWGLSQETSRLPNLP